MLSQGGMFTPHLRQTGESRLLIGSRPHHLDQPLRQTSGLVGWTLLTVILPHGPSLHLSQTRESEQPISARARVLDTLLDLDTLVCPNQVAEDLDIASGGYEGLMAAALIVVDVFADDPPVRDVEELFAVNGIDMGKTVEDETGRVSTLVRIQIRSLCLLVGNTLAVLKISSISGRFYFTAPSVLTVVCVTTSCKSMVSLLLVLRFKNSLDLVRVIADINAHYHAVLRLEHRSKPCQELDSFVTVEVA